MVNKQLITKSSQLDKSRSGRGDFFIYQKSALYLDDGVVFEGQSPNWQTGSYAGEVVFNTGMTGYIESLTDPSYAGQILVFTYPLVGNYGIDVSVMESSKIQVRGVIVSEAAKNWSHDKSDRSLLEWLQSQNIPVLTGVDTRALTKHLRSRGTMVGWISDKPVDIKQPYDSSTVFVSISQPIIYNPGQKKTMILVDCGAKENITRSFSDFPITIKRVPLGYDYTNEAYDGVLISNGPGNPEDYVQTIEILKKAMKIAKPIFGICLGNQLLALAAGASTYKLKFGHRGHNQPCINVETKAAVITSQNHGYAIDAASLPKGWKVLYKNLNDDSVEGIAHTSKPFSSVQFHPEAAPGPTDSRGLFREFYEAL